MRFDFAAKKFVDLELDGDRIAVSGSDRVLTWSELRTEVESVVNWLKAHVRDGRPVMIRGHKEAGMVSSILGCLSAGIPYVPVDTMIPTARAQAICEIANITLVLSVSGEALPGRANLQIPQMSGITPELPQMPWSGASHLAYIIFTSGSSGEPKGVQIQYPNVLDLATWAASPDFAFSAQDVFLSHCSFSFDVSFFDLLASMQAGATLVLFGPEEVSSKKPFVERLEGLQPTVWSSTPSFLSLALTSSTLNAAHFAKLRRFYVAGEVVQSSLVKRLWRSFPQGELWNAYGPTEATVITTLVHVTAEILEKYPTVPIGKVKPGVTMPTTAAGGTDEGELWIVGPNVSPGYLNRPDLNQTKFKMVNGQRGYLTGDVGFHQDGMIFYRGRIDDQIKLHGYRIELEEIDKNLAGLPGVEEAVTVGLRRNGDVKKLVAFVKLKPSASVTPQELQTQLGEKLPYYMIPAEIRLMSELPYNSNHKVDRQALLRLEE